MTSSFSTIPIFGPMKGGPGAVVEYLHLCAGPGGPGFKSASLPKYQGKGCLEIPFPRPHNVSEFPALGTHPY
jgi:hypothetical protein